MGPHALDREVDDSEQQAPEPAKVSLFLIAVLVEEIFV
jgi:hypothetical protein